MASLLGRYWIGSFKAGTAHSVADLLPWTLLLEDQRTVLLKDGALLTSWSVRGPDLDALPDYFFGKLCSELAGQLNALQGGWSLFFEDARVPSSPYPESAFANPTAQLIDSERRANFANTPHLENQYVLTVTYLPPKASHGQFKKFLIESPKADDSAVPAELLDFRQQIAALDEALRRFFLAMKPLLGSEILSYLHSTISTQRFHIGDHPPVFLDRLLPDEELTGGFYPKIGKNHLRVVGIKTLLGPTRPGLFQELNELPFQYRLMARFIALDDRRAEAELRNMGRHWTQRRTSILGTIFANFTGEPAKENAEAIRRSEDADMAELAIQERHASFGYCTLSIAVWDENEEVAEARAVEVAELVRRARSIPVIERANTLEAWLGMVPGNSVANVRRPMLNTIHFSHMAPMSATWAGPEGVNHEQLIGPPHVYCETGSTTPFRFSTYVGDVGHFIVVGPTGAGKSTLLNLLAAQWLRYSNEEGAAQVFAIDHKRSLRCMVRALGGTYHSLSDHAGRLTIQPLRDIDQPDQCEWASNWLVSMIENTGQSVPAELQSEIWSALKTLATHAPHHRTLSVLAQLVQSEDLRHALSPFTMAGPAGRYLDADSSEDPDDIEAVDLGDLLDATYAGPVVEALFNRFERRFTGRPTLLLVDEAWLPLLNRAFADRLRKWLKTLRSKNVAVGFATQEVADLQQSTVAQTVLNACPTHIYLPNPAAGRQDVANLYQQFGLNERQIELLGEARRKSDYLFVTDMGTRLISFSLGPIALALCGATSETAQNQMDRIPADITGPAFASLWLEQAGLPEPADLLREPFSQAAE